MVQKVYSGAVCGMECNIVTVEVDISDGLPCMEMVGYLSNEVKEAKERVRVAMKNSGFRMPAKRITINFAPANLRKNGNAYDLPMALGIILASSLLCEPKNEELKQQKERLDKTIILGELGLAGEIKHVRGVLPLVSDARTKGMSMCIVPMKNAKEAALIEGITVFGVNTLTEACELLRLGLPYEQALQESERQPQEKIAYANDFAQVQGQFMARKAAEIAAAGFHNLLMSGPPGAGKTMIAKCIPSILPPLTMEESLEVSKIYSIAGQLDEQNPLIQKRLFHHPHHTITKQALAGGGFFPRPGIVTLAHRSVLFLDELPEFGRINLEVLRQPLEDKQIQLSRNGGNVIYPADFMLVAAMNPCPCGYFPDTNRCKCTYHEIEKYQNKVSGPILDRFDLIVRVENVAVEELTEQARCEASNKIRERVMQARRRQRERFGDSSTKFNSELSAEEIKQHCSLQETEERFLKQIYEEKHMSARGYYRILRVARTIADLDDADEITMKHLAQAVCFHGEIGR